MLGFEDIFPISWAVRFLKNLVTTGDNNLQNALEITGWVGLTHLFLRKWENERLSCIHRPGDNSKNSWKYSQKSKNLGKFED